MHASTASPTQCSCSTPLATHPFNSCLMVGLHRLDMQFECLSKSVSIKEIEGSLVPRCSISVQCHPMTCVGLNEDFYRSGVGVHLLEHRLIITTLAVTVAVREVELCFHELNWAFKRGSIALVDSGTRSPFTYCEGLLDRFRVVQHFFREAPDSV